MATFAHEGARRGQLALTLKRALALTLAATTLIAGLMPAASHAQAWPSKPIRIIVGFAAGGTADLIARAVGNDMATRLGQPLVVENKPGASGLIALDLLRESPADGYTLEQFVTPTIVASILANKAVPNPATAFTPIGFLYEGGIGVSLNPAAPLMANVYTLKDLIAVAKANPGKVFYSSAGTGSTGHLIGAMLAAATGVEWTHVGHKGVAPATVDLMAGRIAFAMLSVPNDKQLVKEGKLRLPFVTSAEREAKNPDVPSMVEAGFPELVTTTWAGIIAPAGLPKPIADRLTAELKTTVSKPEIRAAIVQTAPEARASTAEEFQRRYVKDYEVFARVIKVANIKVE